MHWISLPHLHPPCSPTEQHTSCHLTQYQHPHPLPPPPPPICTPLQWHPDPYPMDHPTQPATQIQKYSTTHNTSTKALIPDTQPHSSTHNKTTTVNLQHTTSHPTIGSLVEVSLSKSRIGRKRMRRSGFGLVPQFRRSLGLGLLTPVHLHRVYLDAGRANLLCTETRRRITTGHDGGALSLCRI